MLTTTLPDLTGSTNPTLLQQLASAEKKRVRLKRIAKTHLKPNEINQFNQEIIEIWREHLQEKLTHEPRPLGLIESLSDVTDDHPLSFAALILFLIDRGLSNDEILKSGLLHHYLAINLIEKDNILLTYHLLRLYPKAKELLEQASQITTFRNASGTYYETETEAQKEVFDALAPTTLFYTLTGTLRPKSDLIRITTTTPALTWAPTQENIDLLYSLFGSSLLSRAFAYLETKPTLTLKRTLSQTLSYFSPDEISMLYEAIQHETGADMRTQRLKQLTDIIPDATIDILFKHYATPEKKAPVSPWILLNIKPNLLQNTTPEDLDYLILHYPIGAHEIDHIASLAQDTKMTPYRTHLHASILEHYIKNPGLADADRDDNTQVNLERRLFEDPSITPACQTQAEEEQETLQQCLFANTKPFTFDGFINITSYYHSNRARYVLLHRLSQTRVTLPQTNYQLYASILATGVDLLEALNIMHAQVNPADLRQIQIRTLLETLYFIDNSELQARIIVLLKTNFGITNWKDQKFADDTPLQQALASGNETLTATYFSDQDFEMLNQAIQNKQGSSLIKLFANNIGALPIILNRLKPNLEDMQASLVRAIKHPKALQTLLAHAVKTKISLDNLLTFTTDRFSGDTYFHDLVRHPASLRMLSDYLDYTEATFFLEAILSSATNRENPLFIAVDYPESLKLIFNRIPKKERDLTLKIFDPNGNSLLHAAANQPESFSFLLRSHKNDKARIDAINQRNQFGQTPLRLAAQTKTPHSLKLAMTYFLDDASRLAATQKKDRQNNTLLHLATNHAESFLDLFKLYPEEQQLDALFDTNNNEKTPLDELAQHPEVFATVLDNLPEATLTQLRLPQGPLNQSLLHNLELPFSSMEVLLDLYPNQTEYVHAVKYADTHGKTPLDYAIENTEPAYFKRFIDVYDAADRLTIVNTVDGETGQTLFHDNPDATVFIPTVLETLSLDERFTALTTRNRQEETPLHLMVKEPRRETSPAFFYGMDSLECKKRRAVTFERALDTLRPEDKPIAIHQPDEKGNTPLHYAVQDDKQRQWDVMLSALPDDEIFTALSIRNHRGLTPLHLAATEHGKQFATTFKNLPDAEQATIKTMPDNNGNILLHHIAYMTHHLDLVLYSYTSSTELLAALQTESIQGYTPWKGMEYNQQAKNIVQALLSEEDWQTLTGNLSPQP
ncbi:MAG: hypothetical protein P1U36_04350 [Legionellaceae bacterium]|nr:hypothetical protein [Legionellaceae bacterium]